MQSLYLIPLAGPGLRNAEFAFLWDNKMEWVAFDLPQFSVTLHVIVPEGLIKERLPAKPVAQNDFYLPEGKGKRRVIAKSKILGQLQIGRLSGPFVSNHVRQYGNKVQMLLWYILCL